MAADQTPNISNKSLNSVYRIQNIATIAKMSALIKLDSTPDLVDRVYSALLDAISNGSLAPGARITQEEIAEQLAVSRQPVLQAFRLLKKDGFVKDAPGRGVLVSPLDAAWFAQVYEVRGALDSLAAKLAALRSKEPGGYKFDAALIAKGRAAAARQKVDELITLDVAFHSAIYSAARNPLIEQSAALHWRHIRRAMGTVLQSARRDTVWDEHEAIAKAIAAGDALRAESLMQHHGQKASEHLMNQLEQLNRSQLSN